MTEVKCPECGCAVEVPCAVQNYWKGKSLSLKHRRNIGSAKVKWWSGLSRERQQEIRQKQIQGRARALADKARSSHGKSKFIGMLGDIEVYATDFGRVGRDPPSAHANWVRHAHGKPELKVRKPG